MAAQDDQTVAFDAAPGGAVCASPAPGARGPGTSGSLAPAPAHTIPSALGSIRILEELGRGATGVVYRGRDAMLGRDVAVKFLVGAVSTPEDPGFAFFLNGARSAAGVLHPALTLVHHLGHIDGLPWLVMQYVDGPSAGELLARPGPGARPDRAEALAVLAAAAAGVSALHDAGIVHRDVKPANVLLSMAGQALVSDFGYAFPATAAVRQASPFGVAGTPAWMAPEMFDGDVSPRTDVYALGVTAYQLLTGRLPFTGPVESVRESHRRDPLPPGPMSAAGLSPRLAEVLERATSKRPLFRYKTARAFLNALCEACPDTPQGGRATSVILKWVTRSRVPAAPAPAAAGSAAAPGAVGAAEATADRGTSAGPSSRGDLGDLLKTVRLSRKRLRPDADPPPPPKGPPRT